MSTNSDDRLNILETNHKGCTSALRTDKNVAKCIAIKLVVITTTTPPITAAGGNYSGVE